MSPRPMNNGRKLAISQHGTAVAITYFKLVARPYSASKAASRGGARNLASRESYCLSYGQVGNVIAAACHADAIGLPLTRMITVHWEAAGVSLDGMARATGRFIDMLTKAITRCESRTAWIWVHEGGPGKGGHCHILAHVPASLVKPITRLQKRWLRAICGKPYKKGVIHSDPIGGRLGLETTNRPLHAQNLANALCYVLKGADGHAAAAVGLERLEPGGRIIGKRCGTSQNIGVKARAAKGNGE